MRTAQKILLFAVSLIGLAASGCVLSMVVEIPYLTELVGEYRDRFPWINGLFAGFIAALCLCFLLLLLTALLYPGETGGVMFRKANGALRFSRQAVESAVRYSFADIGGISYYRIRARTHGKPEKTTVRVRLAFTDPSRMLETTEDVQAKIEEALKTSLGITAKSVSVEVAGVSQDSGAEAKSRVD